MSGDELTPEMPERAPEHDLAECWADFTKALAIYPATNVRVRERLGGMLDAHAEALEAVDGPLGRDEGIPVLFRNGVLVLNSEQAEIADGSTLEWLQERLDRASLAGIEFLPDLDEDALIEFTKHLLAIYLRRDGPTEFEDLWPDRYAGIVLIDRRFEGRFGKSGEDAPYRGGHASLGGFDDDSRNLIEVLIEDSGVSDSLRRLETRAAVEEAQETETLKAADLIDRIVQFMPADAMKDRKTLLAAVREVLRVLEERLTEQSKPDALSEMSNDMTLSTLLYSVSRSHFSRVGPEDTDWIMDDAMPEAGEAKRKVGHAGDEKIDEDVDAFLLEWEALPAKLNVDLSLSHAEVQGEEAAVLLHYLVRVGSDVHLEGLHPTLDRVLQDPSPEVLDVLRGYLDSRGGESNESGFAANSALLEFLRRTGRTHLLRACGVFTVDWVVSAFPQCFVPYLESLNLRRLTDVEELSTVCERIGAERMLAAMGLLQAEGSQLGLDTLRDLLLAPEVERMPLVRLLLEWRGHELTKELAAFLRKLELDIDQAFLLHRAIDPRFFTAEYLRGLVDLHLGRMRPERLYNQVAEVLCAHIRGTRESEPRSHARVASIKSLADYPSPTSSGLLRELSRWNLFALRKLEPAFIRRLARSVLREARAA